MLRDKILAVLATSLLLPSSAYAASPNDTPIDGGWLLTRNQGTGSCSILHKSSPDSKKSGPLMISFDASRHEVRIFLVNDYADVIPPTGNVGVSLFFYGSPRAAGGRVPHQRIVQLDYDTSDGLKTISIYDRAGGDKATEILRDLSESRQLAYFLNSGKFVSGYGYQGSEQAVAQLKACAGQMAASK